MFYKSERVVQLNFLVYLELICKNTRYLTNKLKEKLENHSAVALLGPRQTGKTTLARLIAKKISSVYLDLESPEDLLKLSDPLLFLSRHRDKLVILDEVRRKPNIFPILRVLIDKGKS